ncbi:MAG: iron-sulfur cluster assembly protein [Verrucomicrobiota bacterium]|nr:iron-sulfur cluster assembly protein [Verrucomicrobiota bacterium]
MFFKSMQFKEGLTLVRDTEATIIPSGDIQVLPSGTRVVISQALGGTVTIRTDSGLFRLSSQDWDALGIETQAQLDQIAKEDEPALGDVPFSEELVWEAMKGCFDPEIPVNIVDLGLIYDLKINDSDTDGRHAVNVKMTLTAQGCGMGPVIAEDAKKNIEALGAVSTAQVDIVWDPPWTPHMISDAGRQKLGLE